MKIKNIQQYRSFYKTTRPVSPELEEHFIGNYYFDEKLRQKRYGWFTMYHGDKDGYGTPAAGIENFLQSFLDMAKDGQAVYEFLQNAVDAGSTHYTMVWGKDEIDGNYYLLVANNGRMFDLDSIRSILNVGSSTKTADSQTIGKFGIGFKLAHRLVGKDNGLQELINENSGPLLFSWKNYEIAELAKTSYPDPVDVAVSTNAKGVIKITDDNPWLFKILITCFPCLPENDKVAESPKMVDGMEAAAAPFSKTEYEVLSRWVKSNQGILNKETYNEGALFFIKLGSGKETELAENNLKEGVKFALAILKETADSAIKKDKVLRTVQLNNEEAITYPDLEYIKLTVNKVTEQDTYAYVRFGVDKYEDLTPEQVKRINAEADIEALFGFRKHNEIGNYFKGAPNLYLYFPLSEEVHNFNYILHSNAFYKGSSRTFLHKGSSKEDGINERLLKTIVTKIDAELNKLSISANKKERQRFLNFYAALLTSSKSVNQDRLWIEAPYIDPIDELLKKYIPVLKSLDSDVFEIANDPDEVFIKKTKIDIDTAAWELENVNWFYWAEDAELSILLNAKNKLGISDYTVFDLLENDGVDVYLNSWLNNKEERIITVLNELQFFDREQTSIDDIKAQLLNLNLFEFSNSEVLSLAGFLAKEKEGYFLIHNTLESIREILLKLGLTITKLNLNDFKFIDIYRTYLLQASRHKGYTELTQLFSSVVKEENLLKLSKSEKYEVFNAFRTFNSEAVTERIKELKLFTNNIATPVCFKNLYLQTEVPWLNKFCINAKEYDVQLKPFLLDDNKEVYQNIIYPFWPQIANHIALNPTKAKDILDDIVNHYTKSTWTEKAKTLLGNHGLIIFNAEVVEVDDMFFNNELLLLADDIFISIQTTTLSYFGVYIPDKCLIPYLGDLPFGLASSAIIPTIENREASAEQLTDLLVLSKTCNIDFFGSNCITFIDGVYAIDSSSGKKQIATSKAGIVNYINDYYPDEYVLIPEVLKTFKSKIELTDGKLVEHLIENFEEDNDAQELALIEIVLGERIEDKKALLDRLTYTTLDASWTNEKANELYLKLLREIVETDITQEELTAIQAKISISKDAEEIVIGNIDSAHDAIEVICGDKKITLSQAQILNLENADNIKLIQSFHDEAKKRGLLSPKAADKLFKVSNAGITDDLVAKFNANLKEKQLENAHQLLFVWLSGKISKEEYSDYSLKSQNGEWYELKGQQIIYSQENEKHIKHSYLLHESYNGLQSLLQLNDIEVFNYNDGEEDIIVSHFLFVKGCTTEVLESVESLPAKLEYLYRGWVNLPAQIRVNKPHQSWAGYLGISPNQFVFKGIQVESENLPEDYLTWLQNGKKKEEFFKAIGINIGESSITKVRKYLLGTLKELPPDIDIEKFNETLLRNTLCGLSGDFENTGSNSVIYQRVEHDGQISIVEKIINHLASKKSENYPVLIYCDTDSFEVIQTDNAGYCRIDELLHDKIKNSRDHNLKMLYDEYNVLKQSLLLNTEVVDSCDELEFDESFVPGSNRLEHDEPFYYNWKKENNISLFKESELKFDLSIDIAGEMIVIGRVSKGLFYINELEETEKELFYNSHTSLEDLSTALLVEHEEIADAIDELISKRNNMLASLYNALNSAGKGEFKSAHLEALESAFKEEDLKQKRKDLIETIKKNSDYSYIWFESYLEFLLTYESKQSTTVQKTISFQEIKRYQINDQISDKYFLLCGASSLIPLNIEDFEDFKITLVIKNSQNEKIKVEGVSKKGQDLLIYCREKIPLSTINKFSDVIQVKISFSPVIDLLERLYKAFTNRQNLDEWEEINDVLPRLQFIYGPPGTGKTTTLCSMIADGVKEKYNAKYLLLTPTNKAADVLCKKLLKYTDDPNDIIGNKIRELNELGKSISITRVGKPTDPELEEMEEDIYQDSVTMETLDYTNILASTIHRIPYFEVIDEKEDKYLKIFRMQDYWDYVVFDEASMINLPYIVFAILAINKFNPNAKFIIAGDPKQIPPVVDVTDKDLEELDIQDENIYTMMGISSFRSDEQKLREGDEILNLDRQYRSVKEIGQLFSDLSYSSLLKHDRESKKKIAKPLPDAFKKLINKNVTFIDIPLNAEHSIFRINKLLYSSYHTYSAIFVAELIKYFDSLLGEKENWSIGLIAPYKAQAILLNKLITSYGISEKLKIYSDTVHGFQGDECDIVFFISNPNNYYFTGHPKCLLSKEYIYNVAISRAKDYLIILHPFEAIKDNLFINKISASYSRHFENPLIRKSAEFEKLLFNQKDFIEKSSYITGHDNVNVFGQIEMKYFIKANENAIDIQLRKFNN